MFAMLPHKYLIFPRKNIFNPVSLRQRLVIFKNFMIFFFVFPVPHNVFYQKIDNFLGLAQKSVMSYSIDKFLQLGHPLLNELCPFIGLRYTQPQLDLDKTLYILPRKRCHYTSRIIIKYLLIQFLELGVPPLNLVLPHHSLLGNI